MKAKSAYLEQFTPGGCYPFDRINSVLSLLKPDGAASTKGVLIGAIKSTLHQIHAWAPKSAKSFSVSGTSVTYFTTAMEGKCPLIAGSYEGRYSQFDAIDWTAKLDETGSCVFTPLAAN